MAWISTTSDIPVDGACVHVTATRFADFTVRSYQGPLAGASFAVDTGEHHVKATAYPEPCDAEPAQPPWVAEEQNVTLSGGANRIELRFHRSAGTTIDPIFDDESATLVRPGSRVRIGGGYEDAAGPGYALDGWDIKSIPVPPASGSPQTLFRIVHTGLPYPPRGLAVAGGQFIVQLSEPSAPLSVYDGAGARVATWPVDYGPTAIRWTWTDGIEAIDDTHFVRTGWLDTPIQCETSCVQSGIEVLELVNGPSGPRLTVQQQIPLAPPYNRIYPVGVTPLGNHYAVSIIDNAGSTRLLRVDLFGSVLAAGSEIPLADVEGIFDAGGRIGGLDYRGNLALYDATTLAPLGLPADYRLGVDFVGAQRIAWLPSPRFQYAVVSATEQQRMLVNADATTSPEYTLLHGYDSPAGLAYKPDTDQLLIMNRVPPIDPITMTRIPTVDVFSVTPQAKVSSIQLHDLPLPVRVVSLAYVAQTQLLATSYVRPGAVNDPIEAVVYLHDLTGALVRTFSLAPFGFVKVESVDYLPASAELLLVAKDATGTRRLVVTTTTGQPLRSYRADELEGPLDLAPMSDGPFAGDIGVLEQGAAIVRIHLP
ncbi:MAG: hypothetical protein ACTHU0_37300 [Kofleriaceae bacterium]